MALKKIAMPKLGESVNEGTISNWLVQEGDYVEEYDPIAEVMTDKVNAEVPSSYSGTIKEIVVQEGETIEVGELICYIEVEQTATDEEDIKDDVTVDQPAQEVANDDSMKKRYSPVVLRLAQEHGVNLDDIKGTGLSGRITRKDLLTYLEHSSDVKETTSFEHKEVIPTNDKNEAATINGKTYELTGVRKAIADKMVLSTTEIPHAWMTVEVDVTNLVRFRNEQKEAFLEREGFSLTYFPFFIYAVTKGLKKYPVLNSTWTKDNKIVEHKDIHPSIAVANDNELFVPVIQHADDKSISGIAKTVYDLANKAKNKDLKAEDMTGGTFTINNTGTFGSVSSMGIINYPQVAILQIESIVKRPVIIDDMFAARDMVNLSLSIDHRVLDGLVAGRFLQFIKNELENMDETTISL